MCLVHTSIDLFLIEFSEELAFLDLIPVLDVELFHDAAGFGLDLDFSDGLDLPGSDYALGQIAFFDLGQLRGIDLGAAAGGSVHAAHDYQKHHGRDGTVDNPFTPLRLLAISVTVHKPPPTWNPKPGMSVSSGI